MKKIEDLIKRLSQYSQTKPEYIYQLLDYIEGSVQLQQRQEIEAFLLVNKNLAQIVKGIQIYYTRYGKNRQQLLTYLNKVRNDGYDQIDT